MKPNMMARVNRMAQIIREKKAIRFGELCAQMGLAPATMYGYIQILTSIFLDISYKDGLFESTERLEEVTSQRRLPQ